MQHTFFSIIFFSYGFTQHIFRVHVLRLYRDLDKIQLFSCLGWFRDCNNNIFAPICLSVDCLPPYIEDADVSNHTYRPGDFLSVSCHEGFQIRYPDMDNMVSVCQDDGAWDNQPTCQGRVCYASCLSPLGVCKEIHHDSASPYLFS